MHQILLPKGVFFFFQKLRICEGQANKSPNSWTSGIKNPGKKATVLGWTDDFSKIPTYMPSSIFLLGDNVEKLSLVPILLVPHLYNGKHGRLCPTQDVFQFN